MTTRQGSADAVGAPPVSVAHDGRQAAWARATIPALVALTAIALALRYGELHQTVFADEFFTLRIVRMPLGDVWHEVYRTSITPPLHYYLAWLALRLGGDPLVVLRLPSLVLGTVTVPLVFLVAHRLGGPAAGLLAAGILALDPFAIYYGAEGRAYATVMFFVTVSLIALLRALDGRRRGWYVLYAVTACAALWCHYTSVFVVVVSAAWALWTHPAERRPVLLSLGAIAAGFAPWIPGFLAQRDNKLGIGIISDSAPLTASRPLTVPLQTLIGRPDVDLGTVPGLWGLVLVVVVAGVALTPLARRRRARDGAESRTGSARAVALARSELGLLIGLSLATVVGVVFYAAAGTSLLIPRNVSASLTMLVVVAAVLLARGCAAAGRPWAIAGLGAVALVVAVGAVRTRADAYRRPPFREAAQLVDAEARPGDPVVEISLTSLTPEKAPPSITDLYLRGDHPVFASDRAEPAWATLRRGHSVYGVTVAGFRPSVFFSTALGSGRRVPAATARRLDSIGAPDGRARVRSIRRLDGQIAVDVTRYAGTVNGRLTSAGGREGLSWSLGPDVPVVPGAVEGTVRPDPATGALSGWSAGRDGRPADWIAAFAGGRLVALSAGGIQSSAAVAAKGPGALLSGFTLRPPSRTDGALRIVAVSGGAAGALAQQR